MGKVQTWFKKIVRSAFQYTGLSGYWSNQITYGVTSDSGEPVNVENGTKIDVAFSCINVLSQDIAKLPFNVKLNTDKGKITPNSPIQYLIHKRPNQYTSAYNFWYNVVFYMLSSGNAYAYIKKKSSKPSELILWNPNDVELTVVEGNIYYVYKSIYYTSDEVLHFKLYSFDGIKGVSPIIYNANSFGYRLKIDKYTAKVMGSKPPGFLSSKESLSNEQQKANAQEWKNRTTGDNIGSTPVLMGGMEYHPLMISPSEGQVIEAAELSDERITGIYRVPPTMVQNYRRATFSNAEQQDLVYSKYAITPITRVIEQECDYKLFTEAEKFSENPPYTKFNIKAMLHGDIKTQTEFYKFLRSFGIANANTIRDLEDMPPLEGDQGEMVVIQGAFVPIDQLREFYNPTSGIGDDMRSNNVGFDLAQIKQHLERLEIQNSGE